jgi:hypothetical protein
MIKHLKPRSEEEIENAFQKDKHFKIYCDKRTKELEKCAKRDNLSLEDYIKQCLGKKSLFEYKQFLLKQYEQKGCHSFWHRECINKGHECYHCNKYYSMSEWDKMTKKKKNKYERENY